MADDAQMAEAAPITSSKKGTDLVKLEADVQVQMQAAAQGRLSETVEALLSIEKTQRLAADVPGTKLAVVAIVRACFQARAWSALNENILLISKRRSQLKQAITAMVQESMTFLDATPDVDTKVALIKTLVTVAEGKIFVEVERARLTRLLARLAEERGNLQEAADIMQEVAVETYGALAKEEKVAFVLEQVRLVLDRGDFVRAQILAKKVNPRTFMEREQKAGEKAKRDVGVTPAAEGTPSLAQLKLQYYALMIRYHLHANDYLEVCRAYQATLEAPEVAWQAALKRIALFVALAPRSPMQQSLLASTLADKRLAELPVHASLLKQLSTHELVRWGALSAALEPELAVEGEVFSGETGAARRADLALRVQEHNMHVVARYYSRVSLSRLAELLDLSVPQAEARLSCMVSAKALKAKLDRPAGVVSFAAAGTGDGPDELLNRWAASTEKLLGLVEVATHKMHKEATTHKVPLSAA